MEEKITKTNDVITANDAVVVGKIVSPFSFSHGVYGENFYLVDLEVPRLSNQVDVIPVMISDRLVNINEHYIDRWIKVKGNFRSYNKHENEKNRLILSIFARDIEDYEETDESVNNIYLEGYVCKKPVYRKTPLGREITDILLAVNRPYGKSDYIPCITWGRNARFAGNFQVGDNISVTGRIQSREYTKRIGDAQNRWESLSEEEKNKYGNDENKFIEENSETRKAYEVSVSKVEMIKETGSQTAHSSDNEQAE